MNRSGRGPDVLVPLCLVLLGAFLSFALPRHPSYSHLSVGASRLLEPLERPAAFLSEQFQRGLGWVADRQELLSRIHGLEQRVDRLSVENATLRRGEMERVLEGTGAYLVDYRNPRAWWDEARVDLGRTPPPQIGAPALKDGALVGIVTESWGGACWIKLISSADSYLPVVVEGTRDLGVLVGDGKGGLWLRYTPPLDLPPGSRLVTALGGDVLPPGLWVGGLSGEKRETEPGQVEYRVNPAADLSRLHSVTLMGGN